VYVEGGTFVMHGDAISGNSAKNNGGGVYISTRVTFTKTGGTIHGSDAALAVRNTAEKQGHAVYLSSNPARWRNVAAGPDDNTAGYGFYLND
jgi:hypothetical protein